MAKLKEGSKAPDFHALTDRNEKVSLNDFKNKRVILYFYPKDDTPGCTAEACGFRDTIKDVQAQEAVVLGVSPDGLQSHQKFIRKYQLPFTLLCDEESHICKAYGVWVKKNMYGREYMGVARTTFVIGEDGKIEKIFEKVKPDGHHQEVLTYLKS